MACSNTCSVGHVSCPLYTYSGETVGKTECGKECKRCCKNNVENGSITWSKPYCYRNTIHADNSWCCKVDETVTYWDGSTETTSELMGCGNGGTTESISFEECKVLCGDKQDWYLRDPFPSYGERCDF